VDGKAAVTMGTALQMPLGEAMGKLVSWSTAEPNDGQMKFYAVNPTTGQLVNQGSSANGHGHWFNASGARSDWGSGFVFSELNTGTPAFNLGQYPGKLTVGKTYTISQAFKYKQGEQTATVKFVFNIECVASSKKATYTLKDYEGEYTGIAALPSEKGTEPAAIYNMSGIRLDAPQKGINIIKMTDGSVKKAIF
jgi:hypothetical protein